MQFARKSWTLPVVLISTVAFSQIAIAQQQFETPEAAATALVAALRAKDNRIVNTILGPGGEEITSSGDETQDVAMRKLFLMAYDATHRINTIDSNRATLSVGPQGFVLPIPIVKHEKGWEFDAIAGREEILFRRIGRNELSAIQVCLAYVDAQHDYADLMRKGGAPAAYAQRFFSNAGKRDGLYWPKAIDGETSPMGEFVALATREGYRIGNKPQPFHGYYYKILTRQGADAPGGALNYVVKGNMIGGFALVAIPAEYRRSGVMTFIVNHDGVVFQKDLGAQTKIVTDRMKTFDPDYTWTKVEATDIPPQ